MLHVQLTAAGSGRLFIFHVLSVNVIVGSSEIRIVTESNAYASVANGLGATARPRVGQIKSTILL